MTDITKLLRRANLCVSSQGYIHKVTGRAADEIDKLRAELEALREQRRWIPVSEGPPDSGVPVIAFVEKVYGGNTRRLRAQYAAPKTLEQSPECEGGEYDEETDAYYCKEGWYESNEFEETHWRIEGEVTSWQSLPPAPEGE